QTRVHEGFLLERGPDCFLSAKPAGLDLLRDLGLQDEALFTKPEFRRSFVLRGSALIPIPDGLYLMAPSRIRNFLGSPLLSFSGKLRAMADLIIPRRPSDGDESLASFVTRRLGREVLDRIAQPMIGGIYGTDPERLSLQATMPKFLEWERS